MSKEWFFELIAGGFREAFRELRNDFKEVITAVNKFHLEQQGINMAILDKLQSLADGNIEIQNAIAEEKAQNEAVNSSLTQLTDTITAQQTTINELLAQVQAGNQTLEQAEAIVDSLTQQKQAIVDEIKGIVNVPEPSV